MNDTAAELSTCTCFTLRRLSRRVSQFYDRQLSPAGLKTTQYSLLRWVERRGAVPMTELAALLGMERSTLTRNVAPLLNAGWLAQQSSSAFGGDPRARVLSLTDAGRGQLKLAGRHWRRAQRQMQTLIGADELTDLHRRIGRMSKLLANEVSR